MTACDYTKQALLWEPETSALLWGEALDTTAYRIPITSPVDVQLTHDKLDPGRVTQYMGEGTPWILGPMGGSFTFEFFVTGHGSATSGARVPSNVASALRTCQSGSGSSPDRTVTNPSGSN